VREYYEWKDLKQFSYSRPVSGEKVNVWTEKTIFETSVSFPTILRRAEIIKTKVVQSSPIENAIAVVLQKNRELAALEAKYAPSVSSTLLNSPSSASHLSGQISPKTASTFSNRVVSRNGTMTNPSPKEGINVQPFSKALSGVVDSPVNGGVQAYKEAFLSTSEKDEFTLALQSAIQDQARAAKRCLDIHGALVGESMRPYHDSLVTLFEKNFEDELKHINEQQSLVTGDHAGTDAATHRRRSGSRGPALVLSKTTRHGAPQVFSPRRVASSSEGTGHATTRDEAASTGGDSGSRRERMSLSLFGGGSSRASVIGSVRRSISKLRLGGKRKSSE